MNMNACNIQAQDGAGYSYILMKILCSADHTAVQDQTTWASKRVRMIRKYHNHKLQTNPWHHEEEQHNTHKTPGRQAKQSNQLSLPHLG